MAVTRSSSTPSPVQKKSSKMGLKSLANRNKGKRPVAEEEDSDFSPPLSKRGRAPPKKKSKVVAQEKIPQDDAQKNDQDGVGLRCLTVLFSFMCNSDCGAFVAVFAEFFIHGKDVPSDFNIEVYRTQLAALFFSYNQRKNDESIDSGDEKQSKSSNASKLKK
ncbi:hypothetical protein CsatA_004833 [Cannabis sativa]